MKALSGHTGDVLSVSFSPDGMTLASGSWDEGTVRLWDVATGRHLNTLPGHTDDVYECQLFTRRHDARLWELGRNCSVMGCYATGRHLNTLPGHTGVVYSVSFSPDGMTLASGSWDETVRLWDVATGRHLNTLPGHTDDVLSVSFSPDGKTLASGSNGTKLFGYGTLPQGGT